VGSYDVEATFTDGVLVSARIKKTTESTWRDATVNGNLITGVNGNPEQALQVTATHAGTGTVAAVVRVRQGIGGALYDSADHLIDETITTTHDRYQDAVDSLDDRIVREQDRLTQYEDRLNAQFARLERALTLINAQYSALVASGLLGTSS